MRIVIVLGLLLPPLCLASAAPALAQTDEQPPATIGDMPGGSLIGDMTIDEVMATLLSKIGGLLERSRPEPAVDGSVTPRFGGMDVDEAAALIRAAIRGNVEAQYKVGVYHGGGIGIPQNSCLATLWFDKAARAGHAEAQINLAFAYASGRGVRSDRVLSYLWFTAAHRGGHWQALSLRQQMMSKMSPRDLERAQALAETFDPSTAAPADMFLLSAEIDRNGEMRWAIGPGSVVACGPADTSAQER